MSGPCPLPFGRWMGACTVGAVTPTVAQPRPSHLGRPRCNGRANHEARAYVQVRRDLPGVSRGRAHPLPCRYVGTVAMPARSAGEGRAAVPRRARHRVLPRREVAHQGGRALEAVRRRCRGLLPGRGLAKGVGDDGHHGHLGAIVTQQAHPQRMTPGWRKVPTWSQGAAYREPTHGGSMIRIGIIGRTRPGRNGEQVARWMLEVARQRTDAEFALVDIVAYELPLLDEPLPPSLGQYTQPPTKKWAATMDALDMRVRHAGLQPRPIGCAQERHRLSVS